LNISSGKYDFSALVLAAGSSSRMSFPKFLLQFDSHTTFAEKICKTLSDSGCKKTVVVVNKEGKKKLEERKLSFGSCVTVTVNENNEAGRFSSVQKGLEITGVVGPVLIHNADNPFIDTGTVELLCKSLTDRGYAFPVFEGRGGHPVIISSHIALKILNENSNDRNLKEYLTQYTCSKVNAVNGNILVNINTSEDYERYFGKLHK